ncbi:MAG: coproporphyrinogen dehydrogenase HemZ [Clostridiaceae bacterium]
MIKVKCDEQLRYHVYHIISLYFAFSDIVFLENHDDEDISIQLEDQKLSIIFFGVAYEYHFSGMNTMRRELFILLREKTGKVLPWGILVGIRPSKIVLNLINVGFTKDQITQKMKSEFLVSADKVNLAYEVALKERELLLQVDTLNSVDLYIGMPFCPSRCLYCSFASNVYKGNRFKDDYLRLLQVEIETIKGYIDDNGLLVNTVYFGGGTPTAVSDEEFNSVMKSIHENFIEGRNILEFTVEAGRADSINRQKLETMKYYGTTRISINPQTMSDDTLRIIGRNHDSSAIRSTFNLAREYGFDNINMDMILGLPGETIVDVEHTLSEISKLGPESITVHGLALKRASRLYEDYILNRKYLLPSQEEMNLMYSRTEEMARNLGLHPYYMYRQKNMVGNLENVGYAKEGFENIYNIVMIEEVKTVIAMGADGISKKIKNGKISRFPNFKGLNDYTERFQEMLDNKMNFLKD